MTGGAQAIRKATHGRKDGNDFLRVVEDVIGFLADFHQDVQNIRRHRIEPGMPRVQLVAQHQPQAGHPVWRPG